MIEIAQHGPAELLFSSPSAYPSRNTIHGGDEHPSSQHIHINIRTSLEQIRAKYESSCSEVRYDTQQFTYIGDMFAFGALRHNAFVKSRLIDHVQWLVVLSIPD